MGFLVGEAGKKCKEMSLEMSLEINILLVIDEITFTFL